MKQYEMEPNSVAACPANCFQRWSSMERRRRCGNSQRKRIQCLEGFGLSSQVTHLGKADAHDYRELAANAHHVGP